MNPFTNIRKAARIFSFLFISLTLFAFLTPLVSAEAGGKTVEDFFKTDKRFVVPHVSKGPRIDGVGDDEIWAYSVPLVYGGPSKEGEFIPSSSRDWPEGNEISIKMLWDEEALYILDSRTDSSPHYSVAPVYGTTAAGGLPWITDGAIFALVPIDSLPHENMAYHFYTTLAAPNGKPEGGMRLRTTYGGGSKPYHDTPEVLEYKAKLTDTGFDMEMKIPWSILRTDYENFTVKPGTFIGIRITLYNQYAEGENACATWNIPGRGKELDFVSETQKFPILALADDLGNVPAIDHTIGEPETTVEDEPEDEPVSHETTAENTTVATEPATEPATQPPETTEAPAKETPPQKTNTAKYAVCAAVVILAVGAAIVVFFLKKDKKIRIIAFVAAGVIAAGCIAAALIPGKDDGEEGKKKSPEETTADTTPADTTTKEIASNLPENLNFNGEKINILARAGRNYVNEFTADYTGDLIGDAVYNRNKFVEEELKVKLNFILSDLGESDAYINHIRTAIRSGLTGDDAYDIIASYAYYGAGLASEGLYYNLIADDDNNYIHTSSPWYSRNFIKQNVYKNRLFFVAGDLTLSATDRLVVTFANKKGLSDYGITDDLCKVVLNDQWTLDYVKNLAKDIYADLNANGEKDKDDYYGLAFSNASLCLDAMFAAMNIHFVGRDQDGELRYVLNSKRNNAAYSKLYDFIYTPVDGIRLCKYPDEYYGTGASGLNYFSDEMFNNDQCILDFGLLQAAKQFVQSKKELSFIILPLPKYDETQKGYYTTPQDAYSLIGIPVNNDNIAATTAVLEMLFEQSYKRVRPTYFETAYKYRYTSDEDTAVLFDMIIDNVYYDFGKLYSHCFIDPVWKLRDSMSGIKAPPIKELSSMWAAYRKPLEKSFNSFIEKLN